MTECSECGGELEDRDKDEAGHYRDKCMDCIDAASASNAETCSMCEDPNITCYTHADSLR